MVIEKDIGALSNIPNKIEEYTQMAGDVVPMLDPFIYIEMLLKQGFKPLLQIHDELCFSINHENDISKVKEVMENAIEDVKVPFKVDVALGQSWGQAKE